MSTTASKQKFETVPLYGSEVPVVPKLATKILNVVSRRDGALDMSTWHGTSGNRCGTVHCIAGWAIVLAGKQGCDLEDEMGTQGAADSIFIAAGFASGYSSEFDERLLERPSFINTDRAAIDELALCAALEATGDVVPMKASK